MTLTITNRDFLRNYKVFKNRMSIGEIKQIVVRQSDGSDLVVKLKKKPQTAFKAMMEQVRKHPIHIKRMKADLFDYI